jgi:hypothetical protein
VYSRRAKLAGLVAAAFAVALLVLPDGEGARPTGDRARPFMVSAEQLAMSFGTDQGAIVAASVPIDVGAVERGAQNFPFVDVPMPADRLVQSWSRRDTGQVITQAVLVYDDPAEAARLNELADRLLPAAFGLTSRPATVAGAETARSWSGPGYQGVSFVKENVVVFVGADGSDVTAVHRLAEAAASAEVPEATIGQGSP